MAENNNDIETTENNGSRSKKKLIIIAAAVLLLLGGAAAFFLMGDSEGSDETPAEVKPVKQAAIYYTIEKPFVVNFKKQSSNNVKYLQVKLKVMARDQAIIDAFKLHLPAIQHELLMLFFSQNYDALNTKEGTKALRKEALGTINTILSNEGQADGLKAVYFTSLIMQ